MIDELVQMQFIPMGNIGDKRAFNLSAAAPLKPALCVYLNQITICKMSDLLAPTLKFFAHLLVEVAQPIEVGKSIRGNRRLIPILGGSANGDGWAARVLPGGADFQLIMTKNMAELDARYVLETDAGDLIYVQNYAIRTASSEVMAKLIKGEVVNPELVYFRCAPRFETASPALSWINERLFIGTGARHPDRVVMSFFEVC